VNRWILGVDFGQRNDRTALAGIEVVPYEPVDAVDALKHRKPFLDVRYLHRIPLNMPYPEQCSFIAGLVDQTEELVRADVVVDATGVGVAVSDSLREVLPRGFTELTITGGAQASREGRRLSVPKRDLVSRLAVAMQSRRLRVSHGLSDAVALFDELGNFGVNISAAGSDVYGARSGHDDLVLATSYAVWLADRGGSSQVWLEYARRRAAKDGITVPTLARNWRATLAGRGGPPPRSAVSGPDAPTPGPVEPTAPQPPPIPPRGPRRPGPDRPPATRNG
jgi:hypothetical protein